MADSHELEPSTSAANRLNTRGQNRQADRKQYFVKKDTTKVNLLDAFVRWKRLKALGACSDVFHVWPCRKNIEAELCP